MTLGYLRAISYLSELVAEHGLGHLEERLRPRTEDLPPHIPRRNEVSAEAVEARWALLNAEKEVKDPICDAWSTEHADAFAHNIEHLIGTVKIPVGLAGPLRVNGLFAHGDYHLPLATSEASLVASYSRGANLITESGGASAALLSDADPIPAEFIIFTSPTLQSRVAEDRAFMPNLRLEEIERRAIREALERVGGNRSHASQLLGISRSTLIRKIKDLDLSAAGTGSDADSER